MHSVEERIFWRIFRNVMAFLIGVFIAWVLIFHAAYAETIAATYNANTHQAPARRYNVNTPSGWQQYTTWNGAGGALMSAWNCQPTNWAGGTGLTIMPPGRPFSEPTDIGNWNTSNYSECSRPGYGLVMATVDSGWLCTGVTGAPGGTLQGNSSSNYYCLVGGYQCPTGQNWTLSGQSCTRPDCVAPAVRQSDGTCSGKQVCYALVVTSTGSCLSPTACVAGALPGTLPDQPICADKKDKSTECKGIVLGYSESGKPLCLTEKPVDPDCQAAGGTIVGTVNGQNVCSKPTNNPTCTSGTLVGVINGAAVCDGAAGCAAGEAPGTVNGVTACYPIGKVTDKKTDQKAGTSGTTTTITPPGGSPTTTTSNDSTTCDGQRCTTTKTTTTGAGTTTEQTTEDQSDFCTRVPDSELCQKTESGTPASDTNLYVKKAQTVTDVLTSFRATVSGSPFYTAASGYFSGSLPAGSCSGLSVDVTVFSRTLHYDATPVLCGSTATSIYSVLGLGVMLAAGWVGFRIAIL